MLKINDIKTIHCGSLSENAYLVCPAGRDDAFIVDPGDGLHPLMLALQASGRKLAAILLTHGHFDHILAAQSLNELHDAPVYIHQLDAEMLDTVLSNPDDFDAVDKAIRDAGIPTVSSEITMIPQNYVTVTDEAAIKGLHIILDRLDESDDVQNVYHNWNEEA